MGVQIQGSGRQLMFPGIPGPNVVWGTSERSDVDKAVAHFEKVRGAFVYAKERIVAKALVKKIFDAGYDLDDITGCIDWLHRGEEFQDLSGWSLAFVGRKMKDYKRRNAGGAVERLIQVPEEWE